MFCEYYSTEKLGSSRMGAMHFAEEETRAFLKHEEGAFSCTLFYKDHLQPTGIVPSNCINYHPFHLVIFAILVTIVVVAELQNMVKHKK